MMAEKLLTIFTAPKAFIDPHTITIQRNALRSWKALGDRVEILVLGADEGIADHAKELGIRHIAGVQCNQQGTPLIDSMLKITRNESDSPYFAIINADIILFPEILDAIESVGVVLDKFLIVGQRWDFEIDYELIGGEDLFRSLKQKILKDGKLHPPMGSDYFIFPRSCFTDIPKFAIGRAGWDNWFIFKSRWERWPVIDATSDIVIAHQSHDYRHLPGGQTHYRLPETFENVRLGGGDHTIFTLYDAQFQLINGKLTRKKMNFKKLLREIEIFPLTTLRSHFLGKVFYLVTKPQKAYAVLKSMINK